MYVMSFLWSIRLSSIDPNTYPQVGGANHSWLGLLSRLKQTNKQQPFLCKIIEIYLAWVWHFSFYSRFGNVGRALISAIVSIHSVFFWNLDCSVLGSLWPLLLLRQICSYLINVQIYIDSSAVFFMTSQYIDWFLTDFFVIFTAVLINIWLFFHQDRRQWHCALPGAGSMLKFWNKMQQRRETG